MPAVLAAPVAVAPAPAGSSPAGSSVDTGEEIARLLVQSGVVPAERLAYARRVHAKLGSDRTLLSVLKELGLANDDQVRDNESWPLAYQRRIRAFSPFVQRTLDHCPGLGQIAQGLGGDTAKCDHIEAGGAISDDDLDGDHASDAVDFLNPLLVVFGQPTGRWAKAILTVHYEGLIRRTHFSGFMNTALKCLHSDKQEHGDNDAAHGE